MSKAKRSRIMSLKNLSFIKCKTIDFPFHSRPREITASHSLYWTLRNTLYIKSYAVAITIIIYDYYLLLLLCSTYWWLVIWRFVGFEHINPQPLRKAVIPSDRNIVVLIIRRKTKDKRISCTIYHLLFKNRTREIISLYNNTVRWKCV